MKRLDFARFDLGDRKVYVKFSNEARKAKFAAD